MRKGKAGGSSSSAEQENKAVTRSFLAMAVCFSLNLGCVTSVIPLARTTLGDDLAYYSLGTLYGVYTLTALLVAAPINQWLGSKWSLVLGFGVYCTYVSSFMLAREVPATRWGAAMSGAVLGGVGAGIVWPAQGSYFAASAAARARFDATREPAARLEELSQRASGRYAAIFTAIFLSGEVVLKLLSSVLQVAVCRRSWEGDVFTGRCADDAVANDALRLVFGVYASVAVLSTLLMTLVPPCVSAPSHAGHADGAVKRLWWSKAADTVRLLVTRPKMALLAPLNIAFGFGSTFLNTYVTGVLIPGAPSLGADKVGYFTAFVPVVAVAVSISAAALSECLRTKAYAMVAAGVAFSGFLAPFILAEARGGDVDAEVIAMLGSWSRLLPLVAVFGVARGLWESSNRAVFADFFAATPEAAFANIVLQSGSASTAAFFLFGNLSLRARLIVCFSFAALSIFAFPLASALHNNERRADRGSEKAPLLGEKSVDRRPSVNAATGVK